MEKINIAIKLNQVDKHITVDEYTLEADITLPGLLYLNQLVGANVFLPDRIFIDNAVRENPYIIRNEDGSILRATATAVATANVDGREITTSATVSIDTEMYLLNDLMSLVTTNSAIGGIVKKDTRKEDGEILVFNINDKLDLYVNISIPDVLLAIENYQKNKTYGERLAISLAQRNALKKLPQFNSPLTNITGDYNSHSAIITIPYYFNNKTDLNKAVSAARQINANILNCKLINVDDDTVMDCQDESVYQQIDRTQFDKKAHRQVRLALSEKYKSMNKEQVKNAMSILYPLANEVSELNNKEIEVLLKYVESL